MTSNELHPKFTAASGLRRLAAFGIDYAVVILPYLGLLGLVGWELTALGITPFHPSRPWLNQGIVFLFLTLPIASYFAICEASAWQATLGKRLMKVTVVNRAGQRVLLKQSFARVAVKFLPWEYFHTILWQWEGWPMNPSPPTTIQIFAMTVGWLVMAGFIVSLFVGSRRTPYDWVAGTVVIRRSNSMAINTRKVSGRRKLRFDSMAELEAEIEWLATADVECLGNWSLGQIFSHLARVMLIAVGETPIRPPLISRLIGFVLRPLLKRWLLETGMPAGIPHKGIPVIGRSQEASSQVADESISTKEGLAELKTALVRYKSAVALSPHPLFGKSREDWDRFNCRHAELHLSFVVPKQEETLGDGS